jgi:hypothetical protein
MPRIDQMQHRPPDHDATGTRNGPAIAGHAVRLADRLGELLDAPAEGEPDGKDNHGSGGLPGWLCRR